MKQYGKWFYLLGMLIAALAGLFGYQADWLYLVLVLLAILAGIFYMDADDLVNAGIRYLVFLAVLGAFNNIPAIGSYLGGMFTAIAMFLAPVFLTALIVRFFKKFFMK
ncbi:MAG: hypothetical protein ABIJ65_06690 [Chloroflexota bacterium]